MDNKDYFYTFLNNHPLAVISTIHADGTPEAAVVGFGQSQDLALVIGTSRSSRKYTNMVDNSAVALVIGWDNAETMQYEGTARELRADEIGLVRDTYWLKNPHAEKNNTSEERYFIITPKWIRYTDLKAKPWEIKEITA